MNAHVGRLQAGRSGTEKVLRLHGSAFTADPSGALYWPDEHLLVVADLHFEKGSSYAARRVFLPPYDTRATLSRLIDVVARYQPKRIVALGDSFHDNSGPSRLLPHDVALLRSVQAGRDWVWIAGNHDPQPSPSLDGDHLAHLSIGHVCFRHIPSRSPCDGEIAGHLHPVAIVGGKAGAVRRRCFVADDLRCIMPAFGAYAGGLNILEEAIAGLFGLSDYRAHVLGKEAVFSVARRQCLAEARSYEPWQL